MANFDIGDRIKHKVFGEGSVVDIEEGNSENSPSHLKMVEK